MVPRSRPRRAADTLALVLLATALTGCGPVLDGSGNGHGDDGPVTEVPSIADVTPLADPRSWQGEVDINLPEPDIRPVEEDPAPQLPARVTDVQGTRVEVTDVSRILALDVYGTLSQTVFELGLGDNVVGRDVSSAYAEIDDRPLVTQNGHELNAEAILELDPTVLITDTSLGPWDVVLQVREAGIPVVVVDAERNLDNLAPLTQQVADALGVPEQGKVLGRRIVDEAAAVRAEIDRVAPSDVTAKLRMVFLYVRGQANVYYMFGRGSGADALITAAGGYDVSSEIGWNGMKPVNDEGLIKAQPDAILMMDKGLASVGGIDGLLDQFPALAQTPAGENQRVITMDDAQVLSYGPRTADVLNALAIALYAPDSLAAKDAS
ncbi:MULTISPECIES: heme/hemin ABC transporter substrate-binding protein [unclassified Nocardioides]|uniref:heme/hemin ABC transporter substrate-binding protein n=1 Tax=unclassified Nocardioides TaxID=2615069 RepID=UPI000703B51D|nr:MULTISPECIES: ABC transporter substrate-binding protein [unclassified Nocardioides]KRC54973.1 hemin receptor [Nocardioides sp. Root79]KRC73677.1 hemin receptor [Nocardioides sp. Root240]